MTLAICHNSFDIHTMTDADTEPRKRRKTDLLLDDCFGVYTDGVSPAAPSRRMDFLVSLKFEEFRLLLKEPTTVTFTIPELVERATRIFLAKDPALELEPLIILWADEAFAMTAASQDATKTENALRYAVQELWLKDNKDRIRRLITDAFHVPGALAPLGMEVAMFMPSTPGWESPSRFGQPLS